MVKFVKSTKFTILQKKLKSSIGIKTLVYYLIIPRYLDYVKIAEGKLYNK